MTYPKPAPEYDTPRPGEEDRLDWRYDDLRAEICDAVDDFILDYVSKYFDDLPEDEALMEARLAYFDHLKCKATSDYLNREPRERAEGE